MAPLAKKDWRRWNHGTEAIRIELTEEQAHALEEAEDTPPRVVNPRTQETSVLLGVDEYQRLKEDVYDDSPWTRAELEALSWQRVKQLPDIAAPFRGLRRLAIDCRRFAAKSS